MARVPKRVETWKNQRDTGAVLRTPIRGTTVSMKLLASGSVALEILHEGGGRQAYNFEAGTGAVSLFTGDGQTRADVSLLDNGDLRITIRRGNRLYRRVLSAACTPKPYDD